MDIKKNIIPQCLADNMRELQKEYQQALEKKNTGLAPFNDDIKGLDKKIKAIKYENFGLQGQIHEKDQQIEKCENTINHLRKCYVHHARNPGVDNVVMVVRK